MKAILPTVAAMATALMLHPAAIAAQHRQHPQCHGLTRAIVFYREATWRWQVQRDSPRSRGGHADRSSSCRYQHWAATRWRARAQRERSRYVAWFRSTYAKWECIHKREGGWDSKSRTYGGGLQFNSGFQDDYGPEFERQWGWASAWPVWAQLVAAERAFRGWTRPSDGRVFHGRGFDPWPNTAAACGLL